MQAIPLAQINRRHARPPPPLIAPIIALDRLDPEVARLRRAVLAEADVDEEVAVGVVGLEIGCRVVGRPGVDGARAGRCPVPAAEFARPLGFVVEGGAEGDYALDLGGEGGEVLVRGT